MASADLRSLLFSIAYRMLGSVAEAEDVVQDAYVRRAQHDGPVDSERAFLTTVTTRLAIDVLRSARVRREAHVGTWLPEPLVDAEAPALIEDEESVSLAFLLLLERLGPVERAVLVLREAFDVPFAELAGIVGRSEDACRQILSRARKRIADDRPRFEPDPAARDALATRFLAAARDGDFDGLIALLADDVTLTGDGGGRARALPRPFVGAEEVARALAAFARQGAEMGITLAPAVVNGQPGSRALAPDGSLVSVGGIDVAGGRVRALWSILDPHKLGHLGALSPLALRPSSRRGG